MSQTNNPPRAPRQLPSWLQAALKWALSLLITDWPLKLLSLIIAVALWIGLITQDPDLTRERTFRNVQVSVINQESLKLKGYVVTSDLDELLSNVHLTVEVPQKNYANVQASSYNPRVNLNLLSHSAGEQQLTIECTNSSLNGRVVSVSPATVTVMVDAYVSSQDIPVNLVVTGQPPAGCKVVGALCEIASVQLSGPRAQVSQVEQVRVTLDLSDLDLSELDLSELDGVLSKHTFAMPYTLCDRAGNAVQSDMLEVTVNGVLHDRINLIVNIQREETVGAEAPVMHAAPRDESPAGEKKSD